MDQPRIFPIADERMDAGRTNEQTGGRASDRSSSRATSWRVQNGEGESQRARAYACGALEESQPLSYHILGLRQAASALTSPLFSVATSRLLTFLRKSTDRQAVSPPARLVFPVRLPFVLRVPAIRTMKTREEPVYNIFVLIYV